MNKPLKVRTARTPRENEKQFVIIAGAPKHYVSGFGVVGPGAIVSLADDVVPGKWMQEVNPSDAAKASTDPVKAEELASKAAGVKLDNTEVETAPKVSEKPQVELQTPAKIGNATKN